jgi:hypothetical protein
MQNTPVAKTVAVNRGPAVEVGSRHSFDAVIDALDEFTTRVEVRPARDDAKLVALCQGMVPSLEGRGHRVRRTGGSRA